MRRTATASALAVVFTGVALAAPTVSPLTVKISSSALGTPVVVSPKGLTLYHYARDTKGTIRCGAACAFVFPPLVVPEGVKPVAGPGVSAAKLGTVKRPDGRVQVTYNGLTLYVDYYDKPGEALGQGQQGVWFAVTPAGRVTKVRSATQAPTPSPNAPAASASSNGGATAPLAPDVNCPPGGASGSVCGG
jgi:predicted lipoprotein with Yx(FWY)xxD motif